VRGLGSEIFLLLAGGGWSASQGGGAVVMRSGTGDVVADDRCDADGDG
jgi:hypothetical protein